ncbi:MAG TPA: hypothetical protein VFI15_02505 [Candidatus Limnocylindrales bacterium]|nr:hypothetical protein [Candidatus Limnocylindrales bacterium]
MVITAPTRITIEIATGQPGEAGQPAAAPAQVAQIVVSPVDAAETSNVPAAYEPAPCHCLDDEDCTADHEHE